MCALGHPRVHIPIRRDEAVRHARRHIYIPVTPRMARRTTFSGIILAYAFAVMGRVCHTTDAKSHKECALKVCPTALVQTMAVVLMLKTTDTRISCAMVLGESYPRILHYFGLHRRGKSDALVLAEGPLRPSVHVALRHLLRDLCGCLHDVELGRRELHA